MAKFLDIDISELREVLGSETRAKYGTYYFRCPSCAKMGKDTKGDNLVFNSSNGKLRCFGCGEGQREVLSLINEHRKKTGYWNEENFNKRQEKKEQIKKQEKKPLWYEVNAENLLIYMCEATEELLEAEPVIEWLYNKHCINKKTIEDCGIGLDADKNAICFPIFSISHEQMLVGFEYRLIGEKKQIWRTKDAPACLASIWGRTAAPNIIICEGYKDAYCLKQMLELQNKAGDYYILTPANGVADIKNHLPLIDFSQYKTCYLLLDNDEAGDKITAEILEEYPFFIDKRGFLKKNNVEDVADYWRFKYGCN